MPSRRPRDDFRDGADSSEILATGLAREGSRISGCPHTAHRVDPGREANPHRPQTRTVNAPTSRRTYSLTGSAPRGAIRLEGLNDHQPRDLFNSARRRSEPTRFGTLRPGRRIRTLEGSNPNRARRNPPTYVGCWIRPADREGSRKNDEGAGRASRLRGDVKAPTCCRLRENGDPPETRSGPGSENMAPILSAFRPPPNRGSPFPRPVS